MVAREQCALAARETDLLDDVLDRLRGHVGDRQSDDILLLLAAR